MITMTKNANLPAMPIELNGFGLYAPAAFTGLTKLELFCLHHGVPQTGDPDLDSIIRKGNHQKAAMAAMNGILSSHSVTDLAALTERAGYHDIQDAVSVFADKIAKKFI